MINRCNICGSVIAKGDIFYEANPKCQLPTSIGKKHLDYAQKLLDQRLREYRGLSICLKCISRAQTAAPAVVKPEPSSKQLNKPQPRRKVEDHEVCS